MIPIRLTAVLALALAAGASTPVAQQIGGPEPEIRAHIDAFTAALRGASAAEYEAMAQAHFSPALLARATPADRRAIFERIRGDFGAITVSGIRVIDGVASIAVRGATGMAGRFELTLEEASPFRITRIAVEDGDDAPGRDTSPIALKPDMTAEAMTGTLDQYLQPLVGRDAFAGVVLIARDGVPLLQRAYGLADRDRGVPAAADMRFNLGSINKLFTKAAIGQLVAAGKLALTDTVGALLPDYPDTPGRRATVDQLLNHRGGIADFFGPDFDAAPKDRFRANADYYRFVAAQPVLFEPGARQQYCNGCYIVLGAIIERVSGLPYETYMTRHVFAPAGMTHAGWFASAPPPPVLAMGYTRRNGPGRPDGPLHPNTAMHGAAGSAAGGGYATAADLLAFDTALRTGALLDPVRTSWMLNGGPVQAGGRARGGIGAAGGAPGINADLESDGTWTIVVLANLDPPAATNVGQAIRRALAR
jgi:CubicO group peptidase (beta-lactamase class C family)